MPETITEKLSTRFTALKNERSSWDAHCKEIAQNLLPRSGRWFLDDRNKGDNSATVTNEAGCSGTASFMVTKDDGELPSGWNNSNVGSADGSATFSPCSCDGGMFTLSATGFSTSSSDVLHTAYQQICGNSEIIARVLTVSGGGWAGVTIRETLMPGSKKAGLKTQLTNNIRREIRTTTNGAASILNLIRPQHIWLRLTRSGNNFVAYTSTNGITWSFAFSATIIMEGCAYVGIFSESVNNAAAARPSAPGHRQSRHHAFALLRLLPTRCALPRAIALNIAETWTPLACAAAVSVG